MTSPREVLEKTLDKYSFTRGYPCGGTETRDNAVSAILSDLAEIVRGLKKTSEGFWETTTLADWNTTIDHIAKLFTDKEQTKKGER